MKLSQLSLSGICSLLLLAGCATPAQRDPQDPFESANRAIFQFNEVADKAITKPIAKGYVKVMPTVGRIMISNFFSNIDDIVVTVNDVLQLKLPQAFSDAGRVLINSTLGAGGLVDLATVAGFEKHNEDFGQTLGYWGVSSGPYLMLPLLGPTDIRDGIGMYIDTLPAPLSRTRPIHTRNQLYLTKAVNRRAQLLDQEKMLDDVALDRYSFIRDAYLTRRQSLVYDGNPPAEKDEDDDFGDAEPAPAPAAPETHSALDAPETEVGTFTSASAISPSKPCRHSRVADCHS